MVKYAGFYPSDKPDPVTPRPAAAVSSAPRMRLTSISEDEGGAFREERTMDISLRSSDFGPGEHVRLHPMTVCAGIAGEVNQHQFVLGLRTGEDVVLPFDP